MAYLGATSLFNDANLVSYYKLEDTSDSKGSNTLINTGSVTFTGGLYTNAANFGTANTTKSLEVTNAMGISGTGAIAISCWIKLSTEITSGTYGLWSHDNNGTGNRYLQLLYQYNGGSRQLQLDNSGNTFSYSITLGVSNWYHLVVNRSGVNQQVSLFVNGVQISSGTTQGGSTTANNFLLLGSNHDNTLFLSGLMDDCAVFNRVLTQAEVSTLAASPGFFALL